MKTGRLLFGLLIFLFFSCTKEEPQTLDDLRFHPLFKVNVLFPSQGLGDRSFIDDVYEAVELVSQDIDFEIDYIVPASIEDGQAWLQDYVESESVPSLIIVAGNQFTPAVNALQGDFDGHNILLIEGIADEYDGLASVLYYAYAPSYIAGYLSAQLTENCRASSIGGFDAPFLAQFMDGFEEGIRDAGGQVTGRYFIAEDFSGFEMPDSAYRLTKQIMGDCDLIYGLATGSNFGIINALRESAQQKYAIGINSDQSWMGYQVVTGSVINNFRDIIRDYVEQFKNSQFRSGSFYLSMEGHHTQFLINTHVLTQEPADKLIQIALLKEKAYWGKKGFGHLSVFFSANNNANFLK